MLRSSNQLNPADIFFFHHTVARFSLSFPFLSFYDQKERRPLDKKTTPVSTVWLLTGKGLLTYNTIQPGNICSSYTVCTSKATEKLVDSCLGNLSL